MERSYGELKRRLDDYTNTLELRDIENTNLKVSDKNVHNLTKQKLLNNCRSPTMSHALLSANNTFN